MGLACYENCCARIDKKQISILELALCGGVGLLSDGISVSLELGGRIIFQVDEPSQFHHNESLAYTKIA